MNQTQFIKLPLWRSQVLPYIRNIGINHHITKGETPNEFMQNGKMIDRFNQNYDLWINNDGLLTKWLLSILSDEILSLNVGVDNTNNLWKTVESQLLLATKEQDHLLKDRFASLKKLAPIWKSTNENLG